MKWSGVAFVAHSVLLAPSGEYGWMTSESVNRSPDDEWSISEDFAAVSELWVLVSGGVVTEPGQVEVDCTVS